MLPPDLPPSVLPEASVERTVMMFAVFNQGEVTDHALRTGVTGYLLRSGDHHAVLNAIAALVKDGGPLSATGAHEVTVQLRATPMDAGLSPREKDVLSCMVDGLSYKMIADQLTISFETVRSHVKRIYEKLQVHNNTEAVSKTLKCGLLG